MAENTGKQIILPLVITLVLQIHQAHTILLLVDLVELLILLVKAIPQVLIIQLLVLVR